MFQCQRGITGIVGLACIETSFDLMYPLNVEDSRILFCLNVASLWTGWHRIL